MFVSAEHHRPDPPSKWTIEDKINIFASRIIDWQLNVADRCINGWEIDGRQCISTIIDHLNVPANHIPHSGWAVLQIVLSYFETISFFKNGEQLSKSHKICFFWGVKDVFGETATVSKPERLASLSTSLWKLRNGLYHSGVDELLVLRNFGGGSPVKFDNKVQVWHLNPHTFVTHLQHHFRKYLSGLNSGADQQLIENFKKAFDAKHQPRSKGQPS